MKREKLTLVAVLLSGSLLFSSCVGSFGLFNRLSSWNQSIGSKFVNELVFLAFNIVPVYGVSYLADALVINSIEFWSGSNPMANVGDVKKVKGENGNYMVKTLENGYSITKEGETASMDLIYNKEANTWNVVANGESAELIKMNNDGTADLFLPNGEKMNVTLDAQGMMAARQATINFCESFYNFNYPVAEEWSTPSSLSYLSFLASNIQQNHLDQLKTQGAAKASIITSSEITPDSEMATVICQIKNAFIINPINGKAERFSSLQDTLQLIKEGNKWLVRKDIPLQNGKQNHD